MSPNDALPPNAVASDSPPPASPPSAAPIAEVIESSTRHVVAEVRRGTEVPAFGSWVEILADDGSVLYGLVSHAETGSLEPGRQAVALGRDREALRREMPHVFELIRTTVRALVLAHWDGRSRDRATGAPAVRQTLPPRPARLHDFVYPCDAAAVARIGPPYDVLRSLARNPDPAVPADDLLVAVLGGLFRAHGQGPEGERALVDAGRALSRLLNDDHERLHSILRRVA